MGPKYPNESGTPVVLGVSPLFSSPLLPFWGFPKRFCFHPRQAISRLIRIRHSILHYSVSDSLYVVNTTTALSWVWVLVILVILVVVIFVFIDLLDP